MQPPGPRVGPNRCALLCVEQKLLGLQVGGSVLLPSPRSGLGCPGAVPVQAVKQLKDKGAGKNHP